MCKPIEDGEEKIKFQGKVFEIIDKPMKINNKKVNFEIARRSPGIRLLIIKDRKLLITKEYRTEIKDFDYRLPGGKVFDTLKEYNSSLNSNINIEESAKIAAKKECTEETGLIPQNLEFLEKSVLGATISWDLYYFIVDSFKENPRGQHLEEGEVITTEWKTFEEVKELCLTNKIKEERTLAILLKFVLTNL